MFRKALLGLWATCVFAMPTDAQAATDIVLYATDYSNAHGSWTRQSDASAAGGQALVTGDHGWSNLGAALSLPDDFVEFTFTAPAATPYHMWVRMRAAGDSKYNDSVFAQFSDAVNSKGVPLFRTGTADGLCVSLAADAAPNGVRGWGWRDGSSGISQPTTIVFATGGKHTLRIQTREDGVAIDQVVLRPADSATAAPGATANDTTIVPKWAAVPIPWTDQDVGSTGLAGGAWFADGVFAVAGAGADIWGATDAFHYASIPVPSDVQIVTRVTSLASAHTYAKAGLMFRDTASATSAHVVLSTRPNGSIEFMSRSAAGATTTFIASGTQQAPVWLRLTRSGTAFTGEISADGTTWIIVGATNVALAPNGLAGLAVTSHDTAQLGVGTFDNFAISSGPATPRLPAPADKATGIAQTPPLAWTATGATSFDVRLGVANPPPTIATGLTNAAFTPPPLAAGTTYYWQVIARNATGSVTGPVWSLATAGATPPGTTPPGTTPAGAPPATGDIVLYSADASNLHGNWARVTEAAAAGGQALTSVDRGWSNTSRPLAAPADYFDLTFSAPALTSYHLWLRMRAGANSRFNDSVFVQFSDVVALSGTGVFSIGSTSGLIVELSRDVSGSGVSGWGWRDGAAMFSQPATFSFRTTGTHTIRIQTREDGVSIDQVVLSRATYMANAPGSGSNDTTIVTKAQPSSGAPAVYSAVTDRNPYTKPALPTLGPAGFAFADPTFGSPMLRVTDAQTRPGIVNRSFRVPSNAHVTAWNSTSTAFYVISNDGSVIPYTFNASTMTAARIQATGTGNGGLTLGFYVEPQFSLVNPNLIYGAVSGGNYRTISQYDFQTGAYLPLINLDTIVGGLSGYVGGVMSGGTPTENLIVFFGGGSQDSHYYALWTPVGNLGGRKLLNTAASTINGTPTNITLNFRLHSAQIDRSGRFVFLYPNSIDLGAPRYASQVYVWDTASDTVTAITSGARDGGAAMRPYGHDASGYGTWVNMDCCTNSTWDAGQWQFRPLTSLTQISDLIAPVQAVKEVYLSDHSTWNNAQPGALVPVISSTYRVGNYAEPWRAWDDEIIGIETANGGGGNVWRFAHHRSNVASDNNPAAPYFWYEPIANVSPNGRWVIFTSNWEKTLGTDSSEGTFRQDVFLVKLQVGP